MTCRCSSKTKRRAQKLWDAYLASGGNRAYPQDRGAITGPAPSRAIDYSEAPASAHIRRTQGRTQGRLDGRADRARDEEIWRRNQDSHTQGWKNSKIPAVWFHPQYQGLYPLPADAVLRAQARAKAAGRRHHKTRAGLSLSEWADQLWTTPTEEGVYDMPHEGLEDPFGEE